MGLFSKSALGITGIHDSTSIDASQQLNVQRSNKNTHARRQQ